VALESLVEGHKRAEIARRLGISVYTYDTHLQAAFHSLRYRLSDAADEFTEVDLPDWYDRIEEMSKRHAAGRQRRASRTKEKRSTAEGDRPNSEGDRSNSEGDRSNSRGNRDKNARVADESVVLTI
jgi:hypothetical protein